MDVTSFIKVTFLYFYILNLNYASSNLSFAVKFNGDDVTGNKPSWAILQLTTLTLVSSFIKNGEYVLAIFHYLCFWFTGPAPSIIMKFEAKVLIEFNESVQ